VAYNYDLLTGGGQYCQIDWRLFPEKFGYAAGVTAAERLYAQTYNLIQYYFGLHESKPYYFADSTALFATTTPLTYATIYRQRVWNEWLIPVANMGPQQTNTSLRLHAPEALGFQAQHTYSLFDPQRRILQEGKGCDLNHSLAALSIPARSLQLLSVRQLPTQGAYHVWGGKRLAEDWDPAKGQLTLCLQAPAGLCETVVLGSVGLGIRQVKVGGKEQPFCLDTAQGLVHGAVVFPAEPVKIEVLCASDCGERLPRAPIPAAPLASPVARAP
jgi:hypothetical protein